MTDPRRQVEALLFGSGKPMTEEQLVLLSKLEIGTVKRALTALKKEYDERDTALAIYQEPNGWKLTVRNEHLPLVKGIVADTELSRACMETLAVIAYKHPKAIQSAVIDSRGSGAYEHIAELERLGFVRKEPSGRSFRLKLTDKFFNYFEVRGDKEVRALFKDIKLPEKQQTLGGLEVTDVSAPPKAPGPLTGFEVVPVSPQPERPVIPDDAQDVPAAPETPKDDHAVHQAFLDELDKKIAAITHRNNDLDKDPLYAKPLPVPEPLPEQPVEGVAVDAPPAEAPAAPIETAPVEPAKPKRKKSSLEKR